MSERDLKMSEINSVNGYNTRAMGMEGKIPIGPIAMVSESSIVAVLQPLKTNYLFFVADKNGKVYYVENGQKGKGWKSINDSEEKKEGVDKTWVYLSQTGEVQTGWVQDNGTWYYLNELTGEHKGIGIMKKGFFEVNKTWYYFDESGAMKENQWFQQKEGWYYADKSGALKVYEWFQVAGKWYFATEKGTIVTNAWIKSNDEVYHFNESGVMAENEWFEANGGWFYASKSGAILRNTKTPDGYYVNENGQWI